MDHSEELSEGKRRVIENNVKNWENDWKLVIEGIMEGTGLSLTDAMLYFTMSNTAVVANWADRQLRWWDSEERKAQEAEFADQRERVLKVGERGLELMEQEIEDGEEWKHGD